MSIGDYYTLDNRKVVPCDLHTWGALMQNVNARRVAQTEIGAVRVSTVFLGIDHSFGGGSPMLFETMVFGGPLDQEQDRCTTWEQAETMHEAICERVRAAAL